MPLDKHLVRGAEQMHWCYVRAAKPAMYNIGHCSSVQHQTLQALGICLLCVSAEQASDIFVYTH